MKRVPEISVSNVGTHAVRPILKPGIPVRIVRAYGIIRIL